MNYHNIQYDDMLNGMGLRVTLFVSGCNNYCAGCQNPQTWDINSGIPFTSADFDELCSRLDHPYIRGLTLSGGDPLYEPNVHIVTDICKRVKERFPDKDIWMYTGRLWGAVCDYSIMKYVDVLIDGPFEQALLSPDAHWVGSSNQRIIDVQKSLAAGKVVLWSEVPGQISIEEYMSEVQHEDNKND